MTWVVMGGLTLVAAWVQALLPPIALLGQAKWPLLWILVLYYGLRRDGWLVAVAALVAGLLHDGLGHMPLGFSVLMFFVFGICAVGIRTVVLTDGPVTAVVTGLILTLALTLASGVMLRAGGYIQLSGAGLLFKGVGSALLGGIGILPVFALATNVDCLAGNTKPKDDLHD